MIDQVAVYDSQFRQVFSGASPMRGDAREVARIMEHPLEGGQSVSDYKVILPIEISLPLIIPGRFYRDIYQEIRTLFQKSELLSVKMRADTYGDMVIVQMPHEERADMHDAITVNLQLKQVLLVKKQGSYAPRNQSMTNTQRNGEQLPEAYTIDNNSPQNSERSIRAGVR